MRSPEWRAAVEAVPREVFLGDRIYRQVDGQGQTLWESVSREEVGTEGWLELAYENATWVTQLDGADAPHAPGLRQGISTSSATLPGLVVRMLEDLDVRDGDRVLEIGTGTGYSTALLCHRLGGDLVTSIEVDPGVAARAAEALRIAGYGPHLVVGDGLDGHPDTAPYDRIIATCSLRTVPESWLAQAVPGARILFPLLGWLHGAGLVALTVTGEGTAHGRFLPDTASFVPARAHAAPVPFTLPDKEGQTRPVRYDPQFLTDWMGRFLAQLAAPTVTAGQLIGDGRHIEHLLIDHATDSHAWVIPATGGWTVIQYGPTRIWDLIEDTLTTWHEAGQPAQREFTLHITPGEQTVRLDTAGVRRSWPLPS